MSAFSDALTQGITDVFDAYAETIEIKVGNVWVEEIGIFRDNEADHSSGDLVVVGASIWVRFKDSDLSGYGIGRGWSVRFNGVEYEVIRHRLRADKTGYYDLGRVK